MCKIVNEYKELREGIYQLKPINKKGEWANINTNTGMILYYKKVTHMPMSNSKISVVEFEKLNQKQVNRWLNKDYQNWMKKYPDVYNKMIERINKLEIEQ